jgi:hypothetical protein
MKWDFFITHAGPDTRLAEELFEQLDSHARVFLDSKRLILGGNWDEELQKAQAESLVTVILVSSNTEKAYYQREEIAAAINMARDKETSHRVVPVYLDATATKSAPYGLRLKHGLMLAGVVDISRAADELLRLLAQLQGGEIQVLDQALAGKIFISYARSDQDSVQPIYEVLTDNQHHAWMDIHDIKGGENWLRAIYKAIEESEIFLAILSNNSVNRRGILQKELKKALDKWEGMLPDDIYIIPLRVDDCPIPELLKDLHVIDWDDGMGQDKLLEAIQVGLERRRV